MKLEGLGTRLYTCTYTNSVCYHYAMWKRVGLTVQLGVQCFQSKEGGRIEKTTTSKGLMHSNDNIKENWTGGAPPFGGITGGALVNTRIDKSSMVCQWKGCNTSA